MSANLHAAAVLLLGLLQRFSFGLIIAAAVFAVLSVALAATGVWPWLHLQLAWGDMPLPQAGMWLQCGLAGLAVMLAAYLPANARIMALETSHRRFQIGMEDVARAYHMAHAADREGVFRLSSEFDAVRERLAHLRDHPDLETLEPDLLEIAAQMSHISRELSEVYSEDRVARARGFLTQRQQEIERFNARLDEAKQISTELRHWLHQVELEESVAASQLERLRAELQEVLPDLGLETVLREDGGQLYDLPRAAE
jgi:hypothetical protein